MSYPALFSLRVRSRSRCGIGQQTPQPRGRTGAVVDVGARPRRHPLGARRAATPRSRRSTTATGLPNTGSISATWPRSCATRCRAAPPRSSARRTSDRHRGPAVRGVTASVSNSPAVEFGGAVPDPAVRMADLFCERRFEPDPPRRPAAHCAHHQQHSRCRPATRPCATSSWAIGDDRVSRRLSYNLAGL